MSDETQYAVVFDDDAIDEAWDAMETVALEKAEAAAAAVGRPQDEAMIFTIGMVLAYRRSRAWLRNMQRLMGQGGDTEISELIAEELPRWDAQIDEDCANGKDGWGDFS